MDNKLENYGANAAQTEQPCASNQQSKSNQILQPSNTNKLDFKRKRIDQARLFRLLMDGIDRVRIAKALGVSHEAIRRKTKQWEDELIIIPIQKNASPRLYRAGENAKHLSFFISATQHQEKSNQILQSESNEQISTQQGKSNFPSKWGVSKANAIPTFGERAPFQTAALCFHRNSFKLKISKLGKQWVYDKSDTLTDTKRKIRYYKCQDWKKKAKVEVLGNTNDTRTAVIYLPEYITDRKDAIINYETIAYNRANAIRSAMMREGCECGIVELCTAPEVAIINYDFGRRVIPKGIHHIRALEAKDIHAHIDRSPRYEKRGRCAPELEFTLDNEATKAYLHELINGNIDTCALNESISATISEAQNFVNYKYVSDRQDAADKELRRISGIHDDLLSGLQEIRARLDSRDAIVDARFGEIKSILDRVVPKPPEPPTMEAPKEYNGVEYG